MNRHAKFGWLVLAGTLLLGCGQSVTGPVSVPADPSALPVEKAVLTSPPNVPPPITRRHAAKVVVELEIQEVTRPIAEGVLYTFWTYGGSVPGSFIRVREGDVIEFHLKNHQDNKFPHNIDLHAVTGPGGGATSTFTAPGHQTQFTFTALNPGLYVYHCATAPVGMHIANGMYGLILVEPAEGLPPVDREYYVMQGDFYTTGRYHQKGHQTFDMQKAIDEHPTYVLFNGAEGALTGAGTLKAEVGERVRLYVGNGGPNLISSFHVIGEIFDKVYTEGGTIANQDNVQTTLVPAGGSTIVEFKVEVPGKLVIVDHALFRTFNKGALGLMEVTGPENKVIYSGLEVDEVYISEHALGRAPADDTALATQTLTPAQRVENGQRLFKANCATCHQAEGQGLPGVFPPLAGSEWVSGDRNRLIKVVLAGLSGPIQVKGANYNGVMPPQSQLADDEIADILTYLRSNLGNSGGPVTSAEVARVRATTPAAAGAAH